MIETTQQVKWKKMPPYKCEAITTSWNQGARQPHRCEVTASWLDEISGRRVCSGHYATINRKANPVRFIEKEISK